MCNKHDKKREDEYFMSETNSNKDIEEKSKTNETSNETQDENTENQEVSDSLPFSILKNVGKVVASAAIGGVGTVATVTEYLASATGNDTELAHDIKSGAFNLVRGLWDMEEKDYDAADGSMLNKSLQNNAQKQIQAINKILREQGSSLSEEKRQELIEKRQKLQNNLNKLKS